MDLNSLLMRIDEKKEKLDSYRPLPPELVKNLDEWFKIELTYTSNAIEGNTLSRSETAIVVEKGITIGGKTINEHIEAVNHAQAYDFIKTLIHKNNADVTIDDILEIHTLILQNIDNRNAGAWRKVHVRIQGSLVVFPNSAKVPQLMDEFIAWLQRTQEHPAKVAADAHLKLVAIHPFTDGNGRTARLLMNLLLLQRGYPVAIISKEERKEYIDSLEKSDNNGADDFYAIIYKAIEKSLDGYLKAVEE
jgi:Fic family protein